MSDGLRKNLIKYGITAGICLVFAAVFCFKQDITHRAPVDVYRIISDSFTIPGMMCIFAGLLTWLSNEGAFHGITYVMKNLFQSLLFFGRRGPVEKYGDYVESQKEKKTVGYGFLFVVGGVCLGISLIMIALYSRVH